MMFTWPDPISFIADVVAIVGIPLLWKQSRSLYKEYRKSHEIGIVSQDCLEFVDGREAINLVPLKTIPALPRPGDILYLPGENREGKNYGGGKYEVERVVFSFNEAPEEVDQPCPALTSKIVAYVHPVESKKAGR